MQAFSLIANSFALLCTKGHFLLKRERETNSYKFIFMNLNVELGQPKRVHFGLRLKFQLANEQCVHPKRP